MWMPRADTAALAAAILLAFAPGYVHPDEMFQSTEILAGDALGFKTFRAWEYAQWPPCRSILVPVLTTGPAVVLMHALAVLVPAAASSGLLLFLLVRATMLMYAFGFLRGVDELYCVLNSQQRPPRLLRAMLCATWPFLVMQMRPFSNAVESLMLVVVLVLYTRTYRFPDVRTHHFALGVTAVAGVFARFTFLFFATPLGVLYLLQLRRLSRHTVRRSLAAAVSGAAASLGVLVAADSIYFAGFTITPINSLLYNADPTNLALHGVHPRYTHALVYMPLLFGPLAPVAALQTGRILLSQLRRHGTTNTGKRIAAAAAHLRLGLALCFLTSLGVLSVAPHQEARFLLPLTTPVLLLSMASLRRHSALAVSTALFALALAVFFGLVHQGGVYRALLHLGQDSVAATADAPVHILFWETYMPPRSLLGCSEPCYVDVYDLAGANVSSVYDHLDMLPPQDTRYLVLPASLARQWPDIVRDMQETRVFWPHFSGENPPSSIADLALAVYHRGA